jgi:DNA polymerase-3 subunit epsilon
VAATHTIWRGLVAALVKDGLHTQEELSRVLAEPSPKRAKQYEYRVSRLMRLALPDQPGVYRFKDCRGEILYVGKATSLKDRVNSYFRGKKNSPGRKLKMLMEAWDIEVTVCETALEAALLETDLIKRHDPPYNVSLKTQERQIWFASRDFTRFALLQSAETPIGPFPSPEALRPLLALVAGWPTPAPEVFYDEVSAELRTEGLTVFCARHGFRADTGPSARRLLAFGLRQVRADQFTEKIEDAALDANSVADKYERLVQRSAQAYGQARRVNSLLNAQVEFPTPHGWATRKVRQGQLGPNFSKESRAPRWAWADLDLADFDRMRVLSTELQRLGGKMRRIAINEAELDLPAAQSSLPKPEEGAHTHPAPSL